MVTTIKIMQETKSVLDTYREYKSESYDEVLKKILYIAKTCETKPELSQQTVKDIRKARERLKKGIFVTEEDAKKRLGL